MLKNITKISFVFLLFFLLECENNTVMTKQNHLIQINKDIELYVETFGNHENEACLFISGAGANSSFWSERLCNNLVKNGFFVIKYDHRDFGYSSKLDFDQYPYDMMDLTKDAITILDSLNVHKAHIIGQSMGGFISQLLAIHYPERVITFTSISSSTNSPKVPAPPEKTWKIFMDNSPNNNFEEDINGFMPVWKYLNGTAEFDKELAIDYTRNLYARQEIKGALGVSHVKAQASLSDRSEQLKKVKIPALIMHGEEDYLVDKYGGIQTAECLENSTLVLIPKMGHIPFNQEVLEQFEKEITNFLILNKK